MSVKATKNSSLIHDVSMSSKGKIIWTGSYEALQCFVKEVLNLSDGTWSCPGGAKQYKSKSIDLRWYFDSKSITLNGELKDQIKEQLISLASIAKELDNSNHNDEIQCKEAIANDSVIRKTRTNGCFMQDGQMLSLEALQSQIQALTKEVSGNTATVENMREQSNPLLLQESKNKADCLKEKIYKLMDENKHLKNENNDLTERINNLSHILADLQQKTKNAEQERESVITAMRLLIAETNGVIENNNVVEQKLCNEADECTQSEDVISPNIELNNRFSVLENEQVNVDKLGVTSNQKSEEDKEQKKKKRKTKAKKKTTNDAASSKPMEGGQAKAKQQEERQPQQQRKTVVVAVDSIIKYVEGWDLSNNKQNVAVKSFSGATVEDMKDFLRPTIPRQPDKLHGIHVGTNNIRSSTPQDIADEITEVAQQFKQESRNTKIVISSLITRSDNPEFTNKVKETNIALKLNCEENNWSFIDNSNLNNSHLNHRGLHLTREGSAPLQTNIGNKLKSRD